MTNFTGGASLNVKLGPSCLNVEILARAANTMALRHRAECQRQVKREGFKFSGLLSLRVSIARNK